MPVRTSLPSRDPTDRRLELRPSMRPNRLRPVSHSRFASAPPAIRNRPRAVCEPPGTSAIRGFSAPASMHRAARHPLVPLVLVLLVCILCGLQTPQPHASRSHPCISRASRSGAFHARTPLVCSSCAFASFTRQHAPASTRLALREPCAPALLASANLALRDPCAPAFPAPPTRPAPLRRPPHSCSSPQQYTCSTNYII